MGNVITNYDNESYRMFTGKAEFTKGLNSLKGILEGITFDAINPNEINELKHWLEVHRYLKSKSPFKEIYSLLEDSLDDNILTDEEIKDISWACNAYQEDNPYYISITADLQLLFGILHGIMADNVITDEEISELSCWLYEHDSLKSVYPYDELQTLLAQIREDGVIDEDERLLLKAFLSDFVDTKVSLNLNETELSQLRQNFTISGMCTLDPEIEFYNKKFCFTGKSTRCSRKDIEEVVISREGHFNNNLTKDTNYLIIGNEGCEAWAFSCYGRKVEKAISMRKEGSNILIVHENDFWDYI